MDEKHSNFLQVAAEVEDDKHSHSNHIGIVTMFHIVPQTAQLPFGIQLSVHRLT